MGKSITQPQVVEIFSSLSRGTTTSSTYALQDNTAVVLALDVTAKTGTNPTLDVVVYDAPTKDGPYSVLHTFSQLTDAANSVAAPTRPPLPFIRAIGTVGGTSTPKFTYTLHAVALKGGSLVVNAGSQGGTAAFTSLAVTSTSATGITFGPNGATNPTLQIDGSTGSAATGLKIKSAAAASGVALSVISSGTNENLTIDAKGSGTISLNVTGTGNIVLGRAATGVSLAVTGGITSSGPTGAGIGYATGAGGTVTQASSITTGVTLNTLTGTITTVSSTLAAGVDASFTLTNSTIAATDTVIVNTKSYGGTADGIPISKVQSVAAGSCIINVHNQGAVTLDAVIVISFSVFKGVAA